jgi:hypothetical protein
MKRVRVAWPALHPRMFVGRVVVHDQVHVEIGRHIAVDLVQEIQILLMSMSCLHRHWQVLRRLDPSLLE